MKNELNNCFKLHMFSFGEYDCLAVCLSNESIFECLDELQKELSLIGILNAKVLFDQLLISGNGKNRFLSILMQDGRFIYASAKNVAADHFYHQITSSILMNTEFLNNSTLTSRQISLISSGYVI